MNRLKRIKSAAVVLSLVASSLLTSQSIFANSVSLNSSTNNNSKEVTKEKIKISGREYYRYGDMLFPVEKHSIHSQFDLNKNKWTDGNVIYKFAPDVTEENRQQFVKATELWSEVAQLNFIERTDQTNYIYVENGDGNFATVGMVGGQQTLTMNNWGNLYVVVHELGHSLGMWHEQQRSNRDDYIDILTENILDNQHHNFNLRTTSDYGAYDFLSVMQYSSKAWTKNGLNTIQPKSDYTHFTSHMGQRRFLSGGDQYSVAAHYGAKTITIPDAAFKSYLVENFDTNTDGEIDTLEAAKVESIQTPGNAEISSIEGIRFFRFLKTLNVSNENLTQIPELPNHLVEVDFSNNNIEAVDSAWVLPPMINKLQLAGNLIDEYSCEDIKFIESTIDGSFTYSPSKSGNNLICDDSASYVLFNGKTRFDLRSKGAQTYHIDVPAGTGQLKVETTNFEQQVGGEMDVYLAFGKQPANNDYDHFSNNSGNQETITVDNPQAGTWYILLQPNDRSFESVNLTASFGDSTTPSNLLENGQVVAGLSGDKDSSKVFVFDVPEGAVNLKFDISGGSGDADLYVKFGQTPTTADYDCRPWKNGNLESCPIDNIQTGRYYVMLQGYNSYQGLNLVAQYEISNGQQGGSSTHNNLSGNAGHWVDFPVEIPAGMSSLTVTMSDGSGDADLYVRYASQPTSSAYDCRPYLTGNNESCTINNPQQGNWYISIRGYTNYSGVNLNIEWKP